MSGVPPCDCYKRPPEAVPLTLTFDHNGLSSLCEFCKGLIDAGLVRPELVDGQLRYRQWHFTWAPGDLVGPAEEPR